MCQAKPDVTIALVASARESPSGFPLVASSAS
jgi:hypothetical protein